MKRFFQVLSWWRPFRVKTCCYENYQK